MLFGKKKITEIEAAGLFVIAITKNIQEYWPSIAQELNQFLIEDQNVLPEDAFAGYEFCLAVIACQLQALPNLLNEEQAKRIREYVLQCISSPEHGSYPKDTIEEYQSGWDASLKKGKIPFESIAYILFHKLECDSSVEVGGIKYIEPIFLMALSEKVIKFGGPLWKNLIQKYKIVP